MKILHVHSGNMVGGVERMLETLAPATAGTAPILSSFALCFEGAVSDMLRVARADVHQLGPVHVRRVPEIRRGRHVLHRLLEDRPVDAVFVHSAWSQAIFGPTILTSGIPLVRWLHAPQPGPRWLEWWSARARPSLVLCNSRYTADAAGGRLGTLPVSVHYPPSVTAVPRPDARAAVRAALGTRPGAIVVVLASRLEAGKGHARLIEALAPVQNPHWEAWIVGGVQHAGEIAYVEALRTLAATKGVARRIRFLGQRTDVPDVFAAADLYCQPNDAPDSFGLSFVEALSAALPVITTRMGAAPEIVDDSCGVLVEPGSATALTDALRTLIDTETTRERLSAAARTRAREFCNLPHSLSRLADDLVGRLALAPALT